MASCPKVKFPLPLLSRSLIQVSSKVYESAYARYAWRETALDRKRLALPSLSHPRLFSAKTDYTIPDYNATARSKFPKFTSIQGIVTLREKILARERKFKFENFSSLDNNRISALSNYYFPRILYFRIPDYNGSARPFR